MILTENSEKILTENSEKILTEKSIGFPYQNMKILCSVVLLCASIRLTESAEATRLVFTKQGPVRGRRIEVRPDLGLGKVDAFFGLPYASPPTGQFRFMPPMVRFMFRKCLL